MESEGILSNIILLSNLKKGDFFIFLNEQKAIYMGSLNLSCEYETDSDIIFQVLKKTKMSVKAKPIDDKVEYIFKFSGRRSRRDSDCMIQTIKESDVYDIMAESGISVRNIKI